jgi:hypothetical protein
MKIFNLSLSSWLGCNMREFIRQTAEQVEKRRNEYATNDEFSKSLTLNISKITGSILVKFGTIKKQGKFSQPAKISAFQVP